MSFKVERGYFPPSTSTTKTSKTPDYRFERILSQVIEDKELKISAHARRRMDERDIQLDKGDIEVLNAAVEQLEQKGSREGLMLYKDMAFIASVNNRTIITAMKEQEVDVITNIDSAIILK